MIIYDVLRARKKKESFIMIYEQNISAKYIGIGKFYGTSNIFECTGTLIL